MILDKVILTSVGRERWLADEEMRQKHRLPLRGICLQRELEVYTEEGATSSIDGQGRVCVKCPLDRPVVDDDGTLIERDQKDKQGYAYLLFDEYDLPD
jgi:hypothetical protein